MLLFLFFFHILSETPTLVFSVSVSIHPAIVTIMLQRERIEEDKKERKKCIGIYIYIT